MERRHVSRAMFFVILFDRLNEEIESQAITLILNMVGIAAIAPLRASSRLIRAGEIHAASASSDRDGPLAAFPASPRVFGASRLMRLDPAFN